MFSRIQNQNHFEEFSDFLAKTMLWILIILWLIDWNIFTLSIETMVFLKQSLSQIVFQYVYEIHHGIIHPNLGYQFIGAKNFPKIT